MSAYECLVSFWKRILYLFQLPMRAEQQLRAWGGLLAQARVAAALALEPALPKPCWGWGSHRPKDCLLFPSQLLAYSLVKHVPWRTWNAEVNLAEGKAVTPWGEEATFPSRSLEGPRDGRGCSQQGSTSPGLRQLGGHSPLPTSPGRAPLLPTLHHCAAHHSHAGSLKLSHRCAHQLRCSTVPRLPCCMRGCAWGRHSRHQPASSLPSLETHVKGPQTPAGGEEERRIWQTGGKVV